MMIIEVLGRGLLSFGFRWVWFYRGRIHRIYKHSKIGLNKVLGRLFVELGLVSLRSMVSKGLIGVCGYKMP